MPNLNPAVDPAEESDFAVVLSVFTALLSDPEAVDCELLQPEMNPMTIKVIKMAANRFMYFFLIKKNVFGLPSSLFLSVKNQVFIRTAGKCFTHFEFPETLKSFRYK